MNPYWSAGICSIRNKEPTLASSNKATLVWYETCTVQARPSTVVSLKDWPTVKETLVVRTLVDVLMDKLSPCWVISTTGLEAAATAIFLKKTFTPDPTPHTHTDRQNCCWLRFSFIQLIKHFDPRQEDFWCLSQKLFQLLWIEMLQQTKLL